MSETITSTNGAAILLSVTQSVVVFTSLLPPFAEVRKADEHDADMRADVRMGEIAASTLVVGIGVIASAVTKSPLPAMASIVCAVILAAMYESVLRNYSWKGTATNVNRPAY